MPLTFSMSFPVRSYECDYYGHVNQANYLRYMQEAAVGASTAVGYDDARYRELGTLWLIRDLHIEYHNQLRFGDTVEVRTWVDDFRRVRSRRHYELRSAATGQPAAVASADWVYLNRVTWQPVQIDAAMIAAFAPDPADRTQASQRRAPFEPLPPVPPGAFVEERVVEWRDIDLARHVNNANYLAYMEEASVKAAAARGWPMERIEAAGFGIMARSHHIEYRVQCGLGETLKVTTYLADPRRSTVYRIYLIHRASDGALVAQSRSQFMCVDLHNGGLMRFPPQFVDDFGDSIVRSAS
jgi:acyl-CoA thioester hydrolase